MDQATKDKIINDMIEDWKAEGLSPKEIKERADYHRGQLDKNDS